MSIKRVSIKHLHRKCFWKRLWTLSQKQTENSVQRCSWQQTRLRSENTEFSNYWELWSSKILWNILWDSDKPKYNEFWKILWKDFLKLIFLERLLLTSKSFLSFWKYLVTRAYWLRFLERFYTASKPCAIGKDRFYS